MNDPVILVDGRPGKIVSCDNETETLTVITDVNDERVTVLKSKLRKHGTEYYEIN